MKRGWLLLALLLGGCAQEEPDAGVPAQTDSGRRVVTYYAQGSPPYASVTMATPSGTAQASPDLPMRAKDSPRPGITYTFEAGGFVYISVQNTDELGRVTCRIEVDGQVVAENTASGGFAIATCKGSV